MILHSFVVGLLMGNFAAKTAARGCDRYNLAEEIADNINQISNDGVLVISKTINEMACIRRCRDADGCESFFYNKDTQMCQLHNIESDQLASSSFAAAPGYHHYKMMRKPPPVDCYDLLLEGRCNSGVYVIYPKGIPKEVYCDQDTDGGGWLVVQRRRDGSEDFYRGWDDYEQGFGNVQNEFWLEKKNLPHVRNIYLKACITTGNQLLANITSQRAYALRVDLENFENETRFAKYASFSVGPASTNYKLHIGEYSGSAGDSFVYQNGCEFSTNDRDNDAASGNCAVTYKGAWWYRTCHKSNLNGLYLKGHHSTFAVGVNWRYWMGQYYSLKKTEMKCRPVHV